ncbi:MAG: aldo/keto reductase [Spirochaetales bacterium]|nr:aldo/keto reductase [Spirochaetales bacterium]
MKYRPFGKLDWQGSALGFGCMRFPTTGSSQDIDYPEAIKMLRHAIDQGVNYADTAYGYHGGDSEHLVGEALKDGYRDRVKLATKLPTWLVKGRDDFDRLLNEQLSKLQTNHIDMYLLHALNKDRWALMKELDVFSWTERAMQDGRIGCLGFSFHDEYDVFEDIVTSYDGWAFTQIQYNYMDEENQAGTKGLELAAKHGLAVIAMEPLLGGNLVNPPDAIGNLWNSAVKKRSPADWALQWLWSKPEVSIILSGMSTMEQVEQNLISADNSEIDLLSEKELDLVVQVKETYEQIRPIACTDCQYCMPCPSGVAIPENLNLYNVGYMYNMMDRQKGQYKNMDEEKRAEQCTQCLECEDKCPQKIIISEWMQCIGDEMEAKA